jgi:hypothetical protein
LVLTYAEECKGPLTSEERSPKNGVRVLDIFEGAILGLKKSEEAMKAEEVVLLD